MKIENIRLGHATNSSSSHSIVIAPPNYENLPSTDKSTVNDLSFGWEKFILADPKSKAEYFAAQLYCSMVYKEDISSEIAVSAINNWFDLDLISEININVTLDEDRIANDIHVDHQSALNLPVSSLTRKFIHDLKKFIENDRVIVYGGNDNGGHMNIPSQFKEIPFLSAITDKQGNIRLKNDEKYWVLYNQQTGAKIRFSFDVDDLEANNYTKASTPELVDVKITNYCPYGCNFCYQGSTKDGIHANIHDIESLSYILQKFNTFEVAIGGGEPTTHPDFSRILDNFYSHGITPNFTTFSKKWLKDKEIVQAVQDFVGGIGVSVHTIKDLEKIKDIAEVINGKSSDYGNFFYGSNSKQIMAQHVVGTHPLDETIDLIAKAWKEYIPVLLLGYKPVGFGQTFNQYDMTGLEIALKLMVDDAKDKHHWTSLSVDTAILDQFPNLCDILGVSQVLTSSPEGKFSMYIDAVDKKMAKSSYVNPDEYVPLTFKNSWWNNGVSSDEYIKKQFAKW